MIYKEIFLRVEKVTKQNNAKPKRNADAETDKIIPPTKSGICRVNLSVSERIPFFLIDKYF